MTISLRLARTGVALALIGAAVVAGCGGDDDGDGGSSSSPEARLAAEFVQRVGAVCKAANPQLAEIRRELREARDAGRAGRVSESKTLKRFTALLRRASAITDRVLTRLRAIEPPEAERVFYRAFVNSTEQGSLNLRQSISAAEAQDAPRLSDLSVRGSLINARRAELIKDHGGFRYCGRG